jgi:hypothetical protein
LLAWGRLNPNRSNIRKPLIALKILSNLTIEDHVSAMKSIQIFVDAYTLAECRDHLWNLLQSSLTRQNNFDEPE